MQVWPRLMHFAQTRRRAAVSRSAVRSTNTGHFPAHEIRLNLPLTGRSLTSQLQSDGSEELVGRLSDLLADGPAPSEENIVELFSQEIYRGVHPSLHHVETVLSVSARLMVRSEDFKQTLSRYLGRSVAMMLEVAEAISEGLMMTQLPAAMAPPAERERDWSEEHQSDCCYLVDQETASADSSRHPLSAQRREGHNVSECHPRGSLEGKRQ